jgi:hypothetical protein
MRPINKDELYDNLRDFLKTKGVNLHAGSYARGIQAGCSFLADAINLSQAGLNRAKNQIDKQLDHARQIIHEKTAPGRVGGRSRPKPNPNQQQKKQPGGGRPSSVKGERSKASGTAKTKRNQGKNQ